MIEKEDQRALVDVLGTRLYVGILFVPDVRIDDYVLLHAGQAMTIVDEKFATESMEEWRNVLDANHGPLF